MFRRSQIFGAGVWWLAVRDWRNRMAKPKPLRRSEERARPGRQDDDVKPISGTPVPDEDVLAQEPGRESQPNAPTRPANVGRHGRRTDEEH
jgi:hypothetical protein